MSPGAFSGNRHERARYVVLLLFLSLCFIGGGAARHDVASLVYLRSAAILCIAALFIIPGPRDFRTFRTPLLLLGAMAALMVAQLVPLPPDLWLSLPGRERYGEAAAAAGIDQPWRPLSLTPDLTLNSLFALLPALTVLIGFASIRADQRMSLLPLVIVAACVSAVIGVFQIASETASPLYLYDVTNRGSPVGFFSNRNHQAVFLAAIFPALRIWTCMPSADRHARRRRYWIAAGIGLFLIPMIMVTGSRAGMVLGLIGIGLSFFVAPRSQSGSWRTANWNRLLKVLLVTIPVALVAAVILFGRAIAIDRMISMDYAQSERRLNNAPVMLDIVRDFFPFGTGFGSFDKVFRNYEPDASLSPFYFNHAHNDLMELAITSGIAGLSLLAIFLIWMGAKTLRAYRHRPPTQAALVARLGGLVMAMLFLSSLVDYPLRTPFLSAVFAIACCWLAQYRSHDANRPVPSG